MFLPQEVLERWVDDPWVELGPETVAFRRAGIDYRIQSAVLFLELVSEEGSSTLIGKVMTEAKIEELGGELMGDSVLFGDAAFSVQLGFLAAQESS